MVTSSPGSDSSRSTHFSTSTTGRTAGPQTGKHIPTPFHTNDRRKLAIKLVSIVKSPHGWEVGARHDWSATFAGTLLSSGADTAMIDSLALPMVAAASPWLRTSLLNLESPDPTIKQNKGFGPRYPNHDNDVTGSAEELFRHSVGSKAPEGRL